MATFDPWGNEITYPMTPPVPGTGGSNPWFPGGLDPYFPTGTPPTKQHTEGEIAYGPDGRAYGRWTYDWGYGVWVVDEFSATEYNAYNPAPAAPRKLEPWENPQDVIQTSTPGLGFDPYTGAPIDLTKFAPQEPTELRPSSTPGILEVVGTQTGTVYDRITDPSFQLPPAPPRYLGDPPPGFVAQRDAAGGIIGWLADPTYQPPPGPPAPLSDYQKGLLEDADQARADQLAKDKLELDYLNRKLASDQAIAAQGTAAEMARVQASMMATQAEIQNTQARIASAEKIASMDNSTRLRIAQYEGAITQQGQALSAGVTQRGQDINAALTGLQAALTGRGQDIDIARANLEAALAVRNEGLVARGQDIDVMHASLQAALSGWEKGIDAQVLQRGQNIQLAIAGLQMALQGRGQDIEVMRANLDAALTSRGQTLTAQVSLRQQDIQMRAQVMEAMEKRRQFAIETLRNDPIAQAIWITGDTGVTPLQAALASWEIPPMPTIREVEIPEAPAPMQAPPFSYQMPNFPQVNIGAPPQMPAVAPYTPPPLPPSIQVPPFSFQMPNIPRVEIPPMPSLSYAPTATSSATGGAASTVGVLQAPTIRQQELDWQQRMAALNEAGRPVNVDMYGRATPRVGSIAGMQRGGAVVRSDDPVLAVVGEQGPELAQLAPGSAVQPMRVRQGASRRALQRGAREAIPALVERARAAGIASWSDIARALRAEPGALRQPGILPGEEPIYAPPIGRFEPLSMATGGFISPTGPISYEEMMRSYSSQPRSAALTAGSQVAWNPKLGRFDPYAAPTAPVTPPTVRFSEGTPAATSATSSQTSPSVLDPWGGTTLTPEDQWLMGQAQVSNVSQMPAARATTAGALSKAMKGVNMPSFGALPPVAPLFGVEMIQPEQMAARFWSQPWAQRNLIQSAWGVRNMPTEEFYRRLAAATPTGIQGGLNVAWGRRGLAVVTPRMVRIAA